MDKVSKLKGMDIPLPAFLIGSCLLCLAVYWPSLSGGPIWDDWVFWIYDHSLSKDVKYARIILDYSWPLSTMYLKWAFGIWRGNWTAYHLVNLALHIVNSLLVYKLSTNLKWPRARLIFFVFLLHPANVITVAWMIQVKTLLCFFFAISSFIFLEKGFTKKDWMPLAWLLFLCSVSAKSSSLPLCLIFLIYSFKNMQRKELVWILPFFLISAWGGYRLFKSPLTQKTVEQFHESTKKIQQEEKKETNFENIQEEIWKPNLLIIFKTLRYYFWQPLFPYDTGPVKATNKDSITWGDIAHVIVVIAIIALFWKTNFFWNLISAHILLLPYLGLIPAPFMNVTIVSDQHLYFALPFFVAFWVALPLEFSNRIFSFVPLFFIPLFIWKTSTTTPAYANEVDFYLKCLKSDPRNITMSLNLAELYMSEGKLKEAKAVVDESLIEVKSIPAIQKSELFPYLLQIQENLKKNEKNNRF